MINFSSPHGFRVKKYIEVWSIILCVDTLSALYVLKHY